MKNKDDQMNVKWDKNQRIYLQGLDLPYKKNYENFQGFHWCDFVERSENSM